MIGDGPAIGASVGDWPRGSIILTEPRHYLLFE
jgi:hypothetical protein